MSTPARPRSRRWRTVLLWTVVGFVFLLLALPFFLSPLAKSAINRRLATLPGYHAQVGNVRIALWKLAIDIDDFVLTDRAHASDGPLIKVAHGSMTLLPRALLRGKLSGHGAIRDTEFLILHEEPKDEGNSAKDGKKKQEKDKRAPVRAAKAQRWQQALQESFAIEITHFEISRTSIRFVDRSVAGAPELTITECHLVAKNLKTRTMAGEDLPARAELTGRFPGGGTLRAEASLAPLQTHPTFKTLLEVKDLALVPLHDFLQSYALVDVHAGTFDVFIEAEAKEGHYAGYVKPFFRDLKFKAVPDPEKSFLRNSATKVASAVTNLLKNEEDKVATRAPFQGDFATTEFDVWETVRNLLRNAFIQSLREGFEGERPTGG